MVGSELKEAWGRWLSETWSWDWWVTLTFRERGDGLPISLGYADRCWRAWLKGLRRSVGHHVYWVRATEFQRWRGAPHFHSLVLGVGNERRMYWVDWWWERFGIARVLPYEAEKGASWYLAKYTVKELGDIRFSRGLEQVKLN